MNGRSELRLPTASLIVAIATLLALGRVVTFEFTSWDDYNTIARNPKLSWPMGRSLAEFWTRPQMDLYVPVTYTVWTLTASIARQPPPPSAHAPPGAFVLNPHLFHALNLLLHIAASCMALALLRELVPDMLAAMFGALLFALHPLQVEAIAWTSGTKDVLFALLALVALRQYIRLARSSALAKAIGEAMNPQEWWQLYVTATAAFVLAMLAKPTAIVTPLVAITLDLFVVRRPFKQVLRTVWPWLLLMVPCMIWTRLCQSAEHAHQAAAAWYLRPMIALDAMAFYLWKLIWPAHLTLDYGRTPEAVIHHGWIAWTWIAPVALVAGFIALAMRGVRIPLAAGLVAAAVLLPVLGFVPFDFQAYSTVADHYVYLAMLGPALLIAWILARSRSRASMATVSVVLLILASVSFAQAGYWRNSHTLMSHALELNPRSYALYDNLAIDALNANDPDRAIELSNIALNIRPEDAAAYLTIADAKRVKGDLAGAVTFYRESLERDPNYAPAVSNLAAILAQQGQLEEAVPMAKRAIALDPESVDAQLNLGRMYVGLNQFDNAQKQFRLVLQLDPTNQPASELLAELDRVLGPATPSRPGSQP